MSFDDIQKSKREERQERIAARRAGRATDADWTWTMQKVESSLRNRSIWN